MAFRHLTTGFKPVRLIAALVLLTCAHAVLAEDRIVLRDALAVSRQAPLSITLAREVKQVTITRGGKPLNVAVGAELVAGDVLETEEGSALRVDLGRDRQVMVLPGTRIRVGAWYLFVGEVLVRIRGIFHIETDFLTAGVEGTEFVVRSVEGGGVDVIVSEGVVRCKPRSARWSEVRVAAAEQLRAGVADATADGRDADVIYRGNGEGSVIKSRARGSDLWRIQQLGRHLDTVNP